jgi:hypothetical protein
VGEEAENFSQNRIGSRSRLVTVLRSKGRFCDLWGHATRQIKFNSRKPLKWDFFIAKFDLSEPCQKKKGFYDR